MKSAIFSIFILSLFLQTQALAQYRSSRAAPAKTYDLGISTGSYNDKSYSEVHLGLNWYLENDLNWRNSVFTRFGPEINTALGWDTSAGFVYNTPRDEMGFGLGLFAGPGLRISNK